MESAHQNEGCQRQRSVPASSGTCIVDSDEWENHHGYACHLYAPSTPLKRVDFFNSLRNKIEKTTLVGGDFNTVGDVTLDVASRNPLAYPNIGGALLSQIMSDKGLVDERREQLGSEVEYTRKGNTTNGVTSTRLDR